MKGTPNSLIKHTFLLFMAVGLVSACQTTKNSQTQAPLAVIIPNPTPPIAEEVKPIATAINFQKNESLKPILSQAKQENKIVFIDFYATWCVPCRMMDETTFRDPELAAFINEECVSYKVDVEKGNGPILKEMFEAQSYPTLVFVSPDGQTLIKHKGAVGISELKSLARQALWKEKNRTAGTK